MTDFVAAIDCGGTSTDAVLADKAGTVYHLPTGPGCNPVDNRAWRASLDGMFEHIPSGSAVVLGMSGYSEVKEIDDEVASFLADRLGGRHQIMNDVELAFLSALPKRDGVLLLAGTGSMAMAHDGEKILRCGGWGHRIGDEGSAHWIGQRALTRAAAELDGRLPKDGFAERLMAALQVPDQPFGFIRWIADAALPRTQIASAAHEVDRLAEQNDPAAKAVLHAAADQLVQLAEAAAKTAELPHPFSWCPAGSVLQSRTIMAALHRAIGPPTAAEQSALGGGLKLAAALASWPIDPAWISMTTAKTVSARNDIAEI